MQGVAIIDWFCANLAALTNSLGLVLDIVGAVLVASEVVRQYRGEKLQSRGGWVGGAEVVDHDVSETAQYRDWEKTKYRNMKFGLGFLIAGFLLQLASNWLK